MASTMAEGLAEFMPRDRNLFSRTMGELLATFARNRWPRDTAKHVARSWRIDPSTASSLIKGHASERTITKALRSEGWPLFMALGEALTGQAYDAFLQELVDEQERRRKAASERQDQVRRLEARAAELVALSARPDAG